MDTLISRIRVKSEEYMSKGASGHDYQHVLRVYNLSVRIGEEEEADMNILKPAALMHDLGRIEKSLNQDISHAQVSVKYARKILTDICYPEKYHDDILHIIRYHSWRHSRIAKSLEHKIMQDADKLDALGAVGIMRCCSFSGSLGRLDYNAANFPCSNENLLDDKKYTIDHFYVKLFKLKDLLHTPTAQKIAQQRVDYMKMFIEQLDKEISGKA